MKYAVRNVAAGLLALAAVALIGAAPGTALAQAAKPEVNCPDSVSDSDCSDQWSQNARARPYCTGATVSADEEGCKCEVEASCSVTADVTSADGTETSTTWTPSLDMTARLDQVDDIDICFKKNSTSTAFVARTRLSCLSDETNIKTAAQDGLCLANCE